MKQNIISLFIFTTFAIPLYAQRKAHINFGYVQIPDSIASIIDRGYNWGPNDEHASSFIRNLQDGKEHTLIMVYMLIVAQIHTIRANSSSITIKNYLSLRVMVHSIHKKS